MILRSIKDSVLAENIELVVVGPEDPLSKWNLQLL